MIRAGAMEVCITPPLGVEMAGYGPNLGRFAVDIHDNLMGQALVIDDGETRVAIVTCDLLGITPEFTQAVRDEAASRTGIPGGNIMLSASHPHTAVTLRPTYGWGRTDSQYMRMTARYLAGAIVAAAGKLQSARISVGIGEHHWLAWNRNGNETIDPTAGVVRVDSEDGNVIALLTYYSCHPVILGPKATISADYPGAVRRFLTSKYSGSVVLFANGVCGDIDPVTNRDQWGKGTFEDVENAGHKLGQTLFEVATNAAPVTDLDFHVGHGHMELGYDIPTLESVRDNVKFYATASRRTSGQKEQFGAPSGEVQMPHFWLGYYRLLEKRLAQQKHPPYETDELQAIAFGKVLALVAIPAEVYAAEGISIRAKSPYQYTLPICYANGLCGYLPPREEFEKGSYTAKIAAALYLQAPFKSNVAEVMLAAVDDLLHETWTS
jgi:neutral ceramidase